MKRKVGYTWRLREVMATRGIFTATELVPLLQERGIDLSASQVHRLVSGTPERLSLQVLSAFCDILGCSPADLVATTAENAGVRKTRHRRPPHAVGRGREAASPGRPDPARRVSPAYRTPEQLERWHKRTCARCGRFGFFAAVWPDGPVCHTCECRAMRLRGRCPECGEHRILPGLRPADAVAICTGCAGFRPSYACSRCDQESQLRAGRLCTRCTLSDRVAELLDDGTGRIRPELVPLHRMLVAMKNTRTGLSWLDGRLPNVGAATRLLRGLGKGDIELTHEAFHRLQPWRAAGHLRELLMSYGVLPPVDKQICSFERWLGEYLAGISVPDHEQIVRRFATWEVLTRLRRRATRESLTPSARYFASGQVKAATEFLGWLSDRGRTLGTCCQADIDAWHADRGEHERNRLRGFLLRGFLLWAMASKLARPLRPPAQTVTRNAPLPEPERIALLGRLLSGHDLPLRSRVAGVIVLLYAQPLSRIVRLTVNWLCWLPRRVAP
ncbi:helix-turn-helix domain-containing protein [Amycolatopsis sp. PS_44_ISF1]|uniref:helix-turn-helix domain-containing protein n=1 Tax=Amycolatopsis sp. PS_44_ISF1 TaxID=2974917 RepID=UPI0028E05848|nr:helix-turn-helix domain-containing protein [Amycolatopsis sp. PS_44_ISF1]MDT8913499.1 helix-turn-helix domain-containing protein [Amycolatopsis sp. PS_44_ISF1]